MKNQNEPQQTQYCKCRATGGTGLMCSICHKQATFDEPQLSAEMEKELFDWIKLEQEAFGEDCIYEEVIGDLKAFLAIALEEQRKTREEEIKQAVKMATLLERQAVIKEVEDIDLLLAMIQSTTEDTPHSEMIEMIKNVRAELRAKLVEMKEGKQ